jgi:hypothetical protein
VRFMPSNIHEDELDIPRSNREIALHLRAINARLTDLEKTFETYQQTMSERRFRFQDVLVSSLIFPLVGGMLLFLLTKGLK